MRFEAGVPTLRLVNIEFRRGEASPGKVRQQDASLREVFFIQLLTSGCHNPDPVLFVDFKITINLNTIKMYVRRRS